jgi:hypothetical protein
MRDYLARLAALFFCAGFLVACGSRYVGVPVPSVESANCAGSSKNLTICMRVPLSQSGVTKIDVADFQVKGALGFENFILSQCPVIKQERVCTASFNGPQGTNHIQIDAYAFGHRKLVTSGTFQVRVTTTPQTETVVLNGLVASVSLEPSLGSSLPLGQTEAVWIVARDREGSIVIGTYKPAISLSATANLIVSPRRLTTSLEAENLSVAWASGFIGNSSGSVKALVDSQVSAIAPIDPSTGVVYYHSGPNKSSLSAGAVAIGPDGSVYFMLNDGAGCSRPGRCKGLIGRFMPSTQSFSYVPLRSVPGISQLYFTRDGALWMSTFQPVGPWSRFPVLRMPPGLFSEDALQRLPKSFGGASGFAEDGAGNLWISACAPSYCPPGGTETPIVFETPVAGSHSAPEATVELPLNCTQFTFGFAVGDIAYSAGSLYVIGQNAFPGPGTIWVVSAKKRTASCLPNLPADFNPSAYFVNIGGSLVFGIGGNENIGFWGPGHGFYSLSNGSIASDEAPRGTATHVSVYGGLIYYMANGGRDFSLYGLATYQPSTSAWGPFPGASFAGAQNYNGVAAASNGAWYTVGGCGTWHGVCLGHTVVLSRTHSPGTDLAASP